MLGIVAMSATTYAQADTDVVNILDANFRQAIRTHNPKIDTNDDDIITYGEARALTGTLNLKNRSIANHTGLEAFENIKTLDISGNNLTSLDLSHNTKLERVACNRNKLSSLDVSMLPQLKLLYCQAQKDANNPLTSIDLNQNLELENLDIGSNKFTNINLSNNTKLKRLICSANQLASLDLSANTLLEELNAGLNPITEFNFTTNTQLKKLTIGATDITRIDLSGLSLLEHLDMSSSEKLCKLNVSQNPLLKHIQVNGSPKLEWVNVQNGRNSDINVGYFYSSPVLKCVKIDAGFTPNSQWFSFGTHSSFEYSNTCGEPTTSCDSGLSVTEAITKKEVQVLNPVKDQLVIKTTDKIEKVEIYNIAGQLVKVLNGVNTNVSDLAKGVYMVKVTTNNAVVTKKIVKE